MIATLGSQAALPALGLKGPSIQPKTIKDPSRIVLTFLHRQTYDADEIHPRFLRAELLYADEIPRL